MLHSASRPLKSLLFSSQFAVSSISARSQLKQRLHDVLPKKIDQFRDYRRKYGEYEIGNLTVNDVLTGCNNSPILFYEGSVMDTKTVYF